MRDNIKTDQEEFRGDRSIENISEVGEPCKLDGVGPLKNAS